MTRVVSWWREQSGPARFRLYAELTLPGAIALVVAIAAASAVDAPWAAAAIVVSGTAAVFAVQAQPDLAAWRHSMLRRWALPVGGSVLTAVWIACVVATHRTDDDFTIDSARTAGIFTAVLAAQAVVPFLRRKWWIVVGVAAACGVAFGDSAASIVHVAAVTAVIGGLVVASTLLTRWGLQIVDELERAKATEARLQVAEERLRFSRDLHDVVGRGFSTIAVKSELAATLSRAGVADRAGVEMDEVRLLAVESMDQMRALVRGYRDINLDGEVAGARSLLAAAGCDLTVEGDLARIPDQFHEVAAWVVREGTTNIVRHSAATSATITLGDAGLSLRNNGVPGNSHTAGDVTQQTGLRGLEERLAHVGAGLAVTMADNRFLLEIQWEQQ